MMRLSVRSTRRARAARITATIAFCALCAPSALAQSVSSSLGVGIATGSALVGPAQSALLLQPSLRWDRPHAALDAQGSLLAMPGANVSGDASVHGEYFSPVFRGLRLELGATAAHNGGPDVIEPSSDVQGDARVSLAIGAGGVWLGGSQLASSSATLPSRVQTLGGGGWRRVGDLVLTASLTTSGYSTPNPFDSLGSSAPPSDTLQRGNNSSTVPRQYADLESAVYWSHGPLSLDALLGTRMSATYGQRTTWGRGEASWAFGNQFALVAAGGTRAPEPAIGRTGGSFMSLGVRLASASWIGRALHGARSSASAFGVRADGALRVVYVRAPAARIVELMADFTDWQPVSMRRTANDEWEVAMPIAPGSHRLNIRVDGGEWTAPPGAGTTRDEFNGVVGLVVVP